MSKELKLLLIALTSLAIVGCSGGGTENNGNVSEDLSFLYVKSWISNGVNYTPSSGDIDLRDHSERYLTYEGNKIIKEEIISSLTYPERPSWNQSSHMVITYTYDGLSCVGKYADGSQYAYIEFLDDSFLRKKVEIVGDTKYVREYDGKKIVKESYYIGDVLQWEDLYEYDGLRASFVRNTYKLENAHLVSRTVSGSILYLDDTYLRISLSETHAVNYLNEQRVVRLYNTYEGKKLIKQEEKVEGTDNGYDFSGTSSVCNFEYDGLKCTSEYSQYSVSKTPPYDEHYGMLYHKAENEIEYMK